MSAERTALIVDAERVLIELGYLSAKAHEGLDHLSPPGWKTCEDRAIDVIKRLQAALSESVE